MYRTMNNNSHQPITPVYLIKTLRNHPWRWLGPALVIGLLAVLYAAVRPNTWAASQALIVRNEAAANREGPGQFDHAEQMKTLQETILEVARSRDVILAALTETGPAKELQKPNWPSDADVEKLSRALEITPPKGTEFGSTEIFYLTVKDNDRDRAVALADAVCNQLQKRLQSIRDAKARSMEAELAKAVALAQDDLAKSTAKLAEIERAAGSDLVELRVLSGSTMGESSLRRTSGEIQNELRVSQSSKNANSELLALLQAAQKDPGVLMAAPNRLFETQPSLKRLKDGLVDSQLATAKLRGSMNDAHPAVMAAVESEKEIGRHIHNELKIAIRGVEADINMDANRIALLGERLESVEKRLVKLAEIRADYANLATETAHRSQLLEQAQQDLARARASQASAAAASLISRIGVPDTGFRPVGPGRAAIVLAGIAGGIMAGFGIVLLSLEPVKKAEVVEPQENALPAEKAESESAALPRQEKIDGFPRACEFDEESPATATFKLNGHKTTSAARMSISEALHTVSR